MLVNELIINYWAQIAVILAAIGYVCKVFLDFSFKRKEIGYSIYTKERFTTITNFLSKYEKAQIEVRAYVSMVKWQLAKGIRPNVSIPEELLEGLRTEMRHSRLFLSAKEFELFHDITACIDNIGSDVLLFDSKLESYKLPKNESIGKWHDEWDEILNKNEILIEKFIDNLRKKYYRNE